MKWLKRIGIGLLTAVVFAALIITILIVRNQPTPSHPFFTDHPSHPLVIAHQGGDGLRPSNTMAAFDHAVALGVDVLELDIHSTADGVLVIIHDDTVDRTTNGTGRVNDLTLAEIQALDAGYNWPTLREHEQLGTYPFRDQGIIIPTLEELFQAYPDLPMVIEIKQQEPSITEPFCALLREYDMTEQVLAAAFSTATLDDFRAVCPEVITSGGMGEIRRFYVMHRLWISGAYDPTFYAVQVPEFFDPFHILTPRFVADVQAQNLDVHAWTINTTADMEKMIELDVDGIITDYPDELLRLGRIQK